MTVKAGKGLAMSRKRQEAETLAGPTWKAITYAVCGFLVAALGLAFWLGETLGEMRESIENNSMGIARLERGLERLEDEQKRGLEHLEDILFEILRQRNGDKE